MCGRASGALPALPNPQKAYAGDSVPRRPSVPKLRTRLPCRPRGISEASETWKTVIFWKPWSAVAARLPAQEVQPRFSACRAALCNTACASSESKSPVPSDNASRPERQHSCSWRIAFSLGVSQKFTSVRKSPVPSKCNLHTNVYFICSVILCFNQLPAEFELQVRFWIGFHYKQRC